MSLLVALLFREETGRGQRIDVNMNAAANVTTEFASYGWLAAQTTVQRQTGRHASPTPSRDTQVKCADGRYLNTGVPPRRPEEFIALSGWLAELGLLDEFEMAPLLEMGAGYEYITLQQIAEDPLIGEIFGAGRDAVNLIATKLAAYDVFIGLQERGIPCGIVYSPEETMTDPHFVERGFPVDVLHEDLGRTVAYPGAPYRFTGTPWELRHRAPHLGEHNSQFGLPPVRPVPSKEQ
jgi:crotonobetainyl-CoA:carnitine CoA-transferase CaiB-like acyl-CoA transferase